MPSIRLRQCRRAAGQRVYTFVTESAEKQRAIEPDPKHVHTVTTSIIHGRTFRAATFRWFRGFFVHPNRACRYFGGFITERQRFAKIATPRIGSQPSFVFIFKRYSAFVVMSMSPLSSRTATEYGRGFHHNALETACPPTLPMRRFGFFVFLS